MKCCLNQHGFKENQVMAVFFNDQNADIGLFSSQTETEFLFTLRVSVWEGAVWEVPCPQGRYRASPVGANMKFWDLILSSSSHRTCMKGYTFDS